MTEISTTLPPEAARSAEPSYFERTGEYPSGFAEFVELHGEDTVLPDFRPIAHQLLDDVEAHPDTMPILLLPRGVGKTTRLLPALEQEAARRGQGVVGVLAIDQGSGAFSFNDYQHTRYHHYDFWESGNSMTSLVKPKTHRYPPIPMPISKGSNEFDYYVDHANPEEPSLIRLLRNNFEISSPGDLLLIDEIFYYSDDHPELLKIIGDMAVHYGVQLIGVMPRNQENAIERLSKNYDLEMATKMEQADIRHCVTNVSEVIGKRAVPLDPPLPLVPMQAVEAVIADFQLDPAYKVVFASNPDTRRLRLFEQFVNYLSYRNADFAHEGKVVGARTLAGMWQRGGEITYETVGIIPFGKDPSSIAFAPGANAYGLSKERLWRAIEDLVPQKQD